ncbi:MAG TPA: hypoxanthine phosphoribosyltransferase [Anaerolineae bacterium]|nr:hypoxanthine phosphoribosyltransferase [Anaerolineae bacterium]
MLSCVFLPRCWRGEFFVSELPSDLARVVLSAETIHARVCEIADQLSKDYADKDGLYIIGILKGAFIFLADLTRQLTLPHVVDFMAVSSYGKTDTFSGAVRIIMDLREPIEGRHVLIVEDIVDTGHTLSYLYRTLKGRKPASLNACVLVQKERDSLEVPIHYLGFKIPDVWVVGYGLDFADAYRTLPYIAELKREEG